MKLCDQKVPHEFLAGEIPQISVFPAVNGLHAQVGKSLHTICIPAEILGTEIQHHGVFRKSKYQGSGVSRLALFRKTGQKCPMSDMHPVKVSDGHHGLPCKGKVTALQNTGKILYSIVLIHTISSQSSQ